MKHWKSLIAKFGETSVKEVVSSLHKDISTALGKLPIDVSSKLVPLRAMTSPATRIVIDLEEKESYEPFTFVLIPRGMVADEYAMTWLDNFYDNIIVQYRAGRCYVTFYFQSILSGCVIQQTASDYFEFISYSSNDKHRELLENYGLKQLNGDINNTTPISLTDEYNERTVFHLHDVNTSLVTKTDMMHKEGIFNPYNRYCDTLKIQYVFDYDKVDKYSPPTDTLPRGGRGYRKAIDNVEELLKNNK